MGGQAFDLLQSFRLDISEERFVIRIHGAGIHEVLPDQDAQRVAEMEEIVGRIYPAPPYAQHVEMRLACLAEQITGVVGLHPGLDHLLGDIIRTF